MHPLMLLHRNTFASKKVVHVGCILSVIIPTTLVCAHFDPVPPLMSSANFQLLLIPSSPDVLNVT